jgi:hypothetical protein
VEFLLRIAVFEGGEQDGSFGGRNGESVKGIECRKTEGDSAAAEDAGCRSQGINVLLRR